MQGYIRDKNFPKALRKKIMEHYRCGREFDLGCALLACQRCQSECLAMRQLRLAERLLWSGAGSFDAERLFPRHPHTPGWSLRRVEHSAWDERKILQEIPRGIRTEILCHNYAQCIQHVSFFYTAPESLIRDMCSRVLAVNLTDGLNAFFVGDPAADVFFVIKGEARDEDTKRTGW